MNNNVIAAIVLYDPDTARLKKNLSAVQGQVDKVLLVLNSPYTDTIRQAESDIKGIDHIRNNKNEGIAKALNQAMQYGKDHGYEWVLTLDQDSVIPNGMVESLLRLRFDENTGIIAPQYVDRNMYRKDEEKKGWEYVTACITSGSLTNVRIWDAVGGFNEKLFIDYVDYYYCAELISHGYKIIQDNDIQMLHEIGHARQIRLGHYITGVSNHSAKRKYFITRNMHFYAYKYPELAKKQIGNVKLYTVKQIIGIIMFEKDKINKVRAVIRGISDSGRMIREDMSDDNSRHRRSSGL